MERDRPIPQEEIFMVVNGNPPHRGQVTEPLQIEGILAQALAEKSLTPSQALVLLHQGDRQIRERIRQTADQLRRELVGDTVTYVINRNVNFTNICEQHCNFCAFRRDAHHDGAFWLTQEEILHKAAIAVEQGATELCIQGGLNPEAKFQGSALGYYQRLISGIKTQFPQLHLHAFSPQEIQFIAREDGLDFGAVLTALQGAGVDSLPGTAAEILDDRVRRIICPEKLDSETWCTIIHQAHTLGIPTTSTMLAGHVETPQQQVAHLARLRELQHQAIAENLPARITEFIILPFVGEQAPLPLRKRVNRLQPHLESMLLLTAVARLFLGAAIPHHQPSWVKLGLAGATEALRWGCNDLGGTLMEEHITTMAGAKGGTCLTPEALQRAIATQGRPAAQRTTLYQRVTTGAIAGT